MTPSFETIFSISYHPLQPPLLSNPYNSADIVDLGVAEEAVDFQLTCVTNVPVGASQLCLVVPVAGRDNVV